MTRRITDDIPGWGSLFHDLVGDGSVSVSTVPTIEVLFLFIYDSLITPRIGVSKYY